MSANSYRHPFTKLLTAALSAAPERILRITGPRQVGKTTAVRQVLSDMVTEARAYHQLDVPLTHNRKEFASNSAQPTVNDLIRIWHKAREDADTWRNLNHHNEQHYVLVLDEIHLIPDWASVVKGLWDDDVAHHRLFHVVILGSSPALMLRGSAESLQGRFRTLALTHWGYAQMRECFDFTLDQYIYFGGYPGAARDVVRGREDDWRNYVATSLVQPNIEKDILNLVRIEKKQLLRALFEKACAYPAQVVAMTKIMGHLQDAGNVTTLSDYLSLLSDAGLVTGLQQYSPHMIRQRASKPKFIALNSAFAGLFSGYDFAAARKHTPLWGHLTENAIGAHLFNTADGIRTQIFYWQTSTLEMDFVIAQGQRVCAVEVKSGRIKTGAQKGLVKFSEQHQGSAIVTRFVGPDIEHIAHWLSIPASEWVNDND